MELPKFNSYCIYSSDKYANTMCFHFGPVTIWFSYKTPVAFRVGDGPQRVLNYTATRTTLKHLKMIDGGNGLRLSEKEFQSFWDKEVSPIMKRFG